MPHDSQIQILVILGPTATGKSDLAVEIAKKLEDVKVGGYVGAEIISADSRQVYRGMDMGTGKISENEMRGIPHHLLDVADPRDQFNVMDFKSLAEKAIADIVSRNKLPIICGGTGFYIDTLLNNKHLSDVGANIDLRKKLETKSASQLFKMLEKLDPDRAKGMNDSDSQNPRRLMRAIEIASKSIIQNMSTILPPQNKRYKPVFIGLQIPGEVLRERIEMRLVRRIEAGMLDEARRLHSPKAKGGAGLSWKRMEDLGLEYRYEARFLRGEISIDEMIAKLNTEIWRYAKRQLTWFKRNSDIKWFPPADHKEIFEYICERLTKLEIYI